MQASCLQYRQIYMDFWYEFFDCAYPKEALQ